MNYKKHALKQLEYLLEPFVFKEAFPANEAARMVLWINGESIETIMSLGPEELKKAARFKLFELREGKILKRRVKNTRFIKRHKEKLEAIKNDASLTEEERDIKILQEKFGNEDN
jgi:hypothetical protein